MDGVTEPTLGTLLDALRRARHDRASSGYYALADVLDRPNLRSDAFRALRQRCPSGIELAYAGAALAYALVFGAFAVSAIIARFAIVVHSSIGR